MHLRTRVLIQGALWATAFQVGCDGNTELSGGPSSALSSISKYQRDSLKRVVVKFRPDVPAATRAAMHHLHGHIVEKEIPQIDVHIVLVPPGLAVADVIARYDKHPLVEFAEPEVTREALLVPNDPWFPNWQIPLQELSAEAAWDLTTGSMDVPIAVLDTGLDYTHFEYGGRSITGFDFADNDPDYYDEAGHGTLVTGVIAAVPDNGVGMAGATWQNPIFVLRTAFGLDTIEAITWATDNGARVISMSFGGHTPTSWESAVMQYAFDNGVVLVAAAGNDGTDLPVYPAAYSTVLAVTGVTPSGNPVGYNWGAWIDLSGPSSALTTRRLLDDSDGDGLGFAGGTSISAPFVAAGAGLVLSVNPDLTPMQVMEILRSTADDLGEPGFDVLTGHGRVNYHAAVLAALNTDPQPDTSPPTVSVVAPIEGSIISGTATVQVDASDDVRVTRVDLFVDDTLISADTVAPHEWFVDTTIYADGAHVFTAVAYDAAGNTRQSAPVQVNIDNSIPCDCPPDCEAAPSNEQPGSTCADGLDNDCDSLQDCDDPDCAADPSCAAPGCNNNGLCESGEDCDTCPGDCVSGSGASCGNGVCEAGNGEDCVSCAVDCNGKQNGNPSRRFCCGDGDGENPVTCGDARCDRGGFACSNQPAVDSCCGDGLCDGAEDGWNCELDCGAPPVCGDGNCDPDEESCSCASDCGTAPANEVAGVSCSDGRDNDCDGLGDCDDPDCSDDPTCPACDNDGACEPGEDCNSCPSDCAGKTNGRPSNRYCCGNGALEGAEGNGGVCDGNP